MYYFIVNEQGGSGKAKKTWAKVQKLLEKSKTEYKALFTQKDISASDIARNISSLDGHKNIVVAGGDGTINEVLNGLGNFEDISLGVIPTGSGNDFARGIGISKNTRKTLSRILASDGIRKIDLGRVHYDDGRTRLFGISSGLGMDAIVCKKALVSKLKNVLNKIGLGKFTYILYTIHTLFSMSTDTFRISFDGAEPQVFEKLIFIAMMNCVAEGGGVKMAPQAKVDDGKLSICIAAGIKKLTAFFYFPLLIVGKHKKLRGFTLTDCQKLEITSGQPATLHLDGEYGGEVTHITVDSLKQKLSILA